ncbi:MAG: ribonuclease D [Rhodospirillaceae bacterium]|nr:ribonuclease D [Rhodospirillaceae bacterium]
MITDTDTLADFCRRMDSADFLAIDTEFMRESTYWPILCVAQVAGPDEAAAIDALADGLDLTPLFELLLDPRHLKVFHSGRQDIEIIFNRTGRLPLPVFDTQLAAMVCGFGESVAYETLVNRLAGKRLDKSSRFTDWAHRPLSERQLRYALDDVIHLRTVYEALAAKLAESGRESWLEEELADLTAQETYTQPPDAAWRRLRTRSTDCRFLAVLREVAAWRELEAQRRNVPRGRVLRDDAIMEIAAHAPKTVEDLARTRGLGRSTAEGRHGAAILEAVQRGRALPADQMPVPPSRPNLPPGLGPKVDLLRVLLKMCCEDAGVAQKLVASGDDLELIAADDDADVRSLSGWRRAVFGEQALALKHGHIALGVAGKRLRVIPVADEAP